MAFDLGAVVAHVKADITDFKKKMGTAKKETDTLNSGVKNIAVSFKTVATAVAGFAGAAGLGILAKKSIEAAAQMEQTRTSFNAMVGDVEKAGKLIKELVDFANVTPFETFDVTDAGKSLLAYGVAADDVQSTLKKIGDVAAGANVPIKDMASIFGKIRSGGLVFTEDLNQLGDRGIPILQVLSDMYNETGGRIVTMGGSSKKTTKAVNSLTERLGDQNFKLKQLKDAGKEGSDTYKRLERSIGKTNDKLKDLGPITTGVSKKVKITALDVRAMASEGKITAEDMEKAFEKMSGAGGMFEDLMAKQSETVTGKLSTMNGKFQILQVTIGEKLFPAVKPALDAIIHLIDQMTAFATGSSSLEQALTNLGVPVQALRDFFAQLQVKLQELQAFYTEHQGVIKGVTIAIAGFFTPAIIALGVQSVITGTKMAASLIFNVIKLGVQSVITSTVGMAKMIWSVIKFGLEGWKAIAMLLVKIVQIGIATVAFIAHTVATIAQTTAQIALTAATWLFNAALAVLTSPIFLVVAAIAALIAIGFLLIKNWDTVRAFGKKLFDGLAAGWNGLVEIIKSAGKNILSALLWPFDEAMKAIGGAMDWIKDKLDFTKRNSPSVVDIVERGVGKVNNALGDLQLAGVGVPRASLAGIGPGSTGGGFRSGGTNINIDLTKAIISSDRDARRMSKKIGNNIVKNLQANIRV